MKKTLTIAMDARLIGAQSTGDSTYWQSLVASLESLESGPNLLLLSNTARPPNVPDSPKIQWRSVPGRGRIWSLVRFPITARQMGADVIHTQYNLSPLAGRRGVTTIHDVSFFIGPEWFKPKDRLILRKFVRASARRAAKVITVSHSSAREIAHYLPESANKIAVTPLGPPMHLSPVEPDHARQLVQDKLSIRSPYALTVGTLWPRKNMNLAVEAMEALPESVPHRLAVTGKAAWAALPTAKRTIATGYVDDAMLAALYSGAELFLVPSLHEGFGLTVLEAFALGCPVLCSSGGALPEVAGDAACIMPNWEVTEWTAAARRLLEDSSTLSAMRLRGHERVQCFSWARTAAETLAVYEEVVANTHG